MASSEDLGFEYRILKNGGVTVSRDGKPIATIGAEKAAKMIQTLESAPFSVQQRLLAKVTGNYRRGNERR